MPDQQSSDQKYRLLDDSHCSFTLIHVFPCALILPSLCKVIDLVHGFDPETIGSCITTLGSILAWLGLLGFCFLAFLRKSFVRSWLIPINIVIGTLYLFQCARSCPPDQFCLCWSFPGDIMYILLPIALGLLPIAWGLYCWSSETALVYYHADIYRPDQDVKSYVQSGSELQVKRLPGGRRELLEEFTVVVKDRTIIVPKGFDTDYSSIPIWAAWTMHWTKVDVAGVIHDWLYRCEGVCRSEEDKIWYLIARSGKHRANQVQAFLGWLALRVAGRRSWRRYTEIRLKYHKNNKKKQ